MRLLLSFRQMSSKTAAHLSGDASSQTCGQTSGHLSAQTSSHGIDLHRPGEHPFGAPFIVTAQIFSPLGTLLPLPAETQFEHEDFFLRRVIEADLPEEVTREVVVAVILTVAKPEQAQASVTLTLAPGQIDTLGLSIVPAPRAPEVIRNPPLASVSSRAAVSFDSDDQNGNAETLNVQSFNTQSFNMEDFNGQDLDLQNPALRHPEIHAVGVPAFDLSSAAFYSFLADSPTPFSLVSGPEHTFNFINQPYLRILGRSHPNDVLGRPIREAVPELEGQLCLTILDRAYRTGLRQTRKGLLCRFWNEESARFEDIFFDMVYHPIRDASGTVTGIMAQAADVTERTLAEKVTEQREDQLYRYWAELETIYRVLPLGIAVVDARTRKILRINQRLARLLGGLADDLIGRNILDFEPGLFNLRGMLDEAIASPHITARNLVTCESPFPGDRPFRLSVRSSLDGRGVAETLTLILQEPANDDLADECFNGLAAPAIG